MEKMGYFMVLLISNAQSPAEDRAHALVGKMNLTEKLTLINGIWGLGWGPPDHPYVGNVPAIPRVGIPWLSLQDGPQGYRDGRYGHYPGAAGNECSTWLHCIMLCIKIATQLNIGTATQWPSGLNIAATWDRDLAYKWGEAMGSEFRAKGANCQLGPGLNVARVPQGGRNFEYMSGEDPKLGSELVGPAIQGIQSNGIMATAKHYILNNQVLPVARTS